MSIATGKRKSDDAFPPAAAAAADSNPNSFFASLSDENWKIIASFASPPDVYSLALSSMHFSVRQQWMMKGCWPLGSCAHRSFHRSAVCLGIPGQELHWMPPSKWGNYLKDRL